MSLFFSNVFHICPFYRGICLQYVEYSGICMLFVFFCNVLHNVPFYRGITCIYREYVEYARMFYVFLC